MTDDERAEYHRGKLREFRGRMPGYMARYMRKRRGTVEMMCPTCGRPMKVVKGKEV